MRGRGNSNFENNRVATPRPHYRVSQSTQKLFSEMGEFEDEIPDLETLQSWKRAALQKLCKKMGLKANGKVMMYSWVRINMDI